MTEADMFEKTLLLQQVRFDTHGGLDYIAGDNPIKNWLRYRLRNDNFDCDSSTAAKEMYQSLWGVKNWKLPDLGEVTGETMCSFWTTYKQALILCEQEVLRKILKVEKVTWHRGIGVKQQVELFIHFDEFSNVNNDPDIKRFAELTHCLGNMIIVPKGVNSRRNSMSEKIPDNERTFDYWDLSLYHLLAPKAPQYLQDYQDEFRLMLKVLKVKKLGLQPWFDGGQPKLLAGHTVDHPLPTSSEDLKNLVRDMNERIAARTKILAGIASS